MGGCTLAGKFWVYRPNLMIGGVSASRCKYRGNTPKSARNFHDGLHRQRPAADADFPHRIGDADTALLERLPQRQHHVAFDVVHAVGVSDPEGEGEFHAGFGEFGEDAIWRLALDGARCGSRRLHRDLAHTPWI